MKIKYDHHKEKPKGEEHKPCAERECKIMLVEPKGVINTGNKIDSLTAENDQWV